MVDFAHPGGGNKDLDKGWGELGEIESIVERHKKILDVVRKEPSKQKVSVASIAKIILAQDAGDAMPPAEEGADKDVPVVDPVEQKAGQYLQTLITRTLGLVNRIMGAEKLTDWTYAGGADWETYGVETDVPLARSGLSSLKSTKGHFDGVRQNLTEMATAKPGHDSVRELQGNLNLVLELVRKAKYIGAAEKTSYTKTAMQISSLTENVLKILRSNQPQSAPAAKPSTSAGPAAAPSAATTDIAAHLKTANDMLTKVKAYETKAGGDQAKTELVQKIQQSLITYVQDLGALIQLQRTVPFAVAAEKAGSGIFKGIKDVAEFDQKAQEYFGQVNEFISDMSQWK